MLPTCKFHVTAELLGQNITAYRNPPCTRMAPRWYSGFVLHRSDSSRISSYRRCARVSGTEGVLLALLELVYPSVCQLRNSSSESTLIDHHLHAHTTAVSGDTDYTRWSEKHSGRMQWQDTDLLMVLATLLNIWGHNKRCRLQKISRLHVRHTLRKTDNNKTNVTWKRLIFCRRHHMLWPQMSSNVDKQIYRPCNQPYIAFLPFWIGLAIWYIGVARSIQALIILLLLMHIVSECCI